MTEPNVETQSNADILRDGYNAFAHGDVPAVLAMFSEDIAWHIPGRNLVSGDYTGHGEVVGLFQALAELSDGTFNLDVHDILDNGQDTVVALVTEHAERNRARLAQPAVQVWRFKNGKATSFQAFHADEHEQDAFWS